MARQNNAKTTAVVQWWLAKKPGDADAVQCSGGVVWCVIKLLHSGNCGCRPVGACCSIGLLPGVPVNSVPSAYRTVQQGISFADSSSLWQQLGTHK